MLPGACLFFYTLIPGYHDKPNETEKRFLFCPTRLGIDLSRGKGDESFGIQDGSEYIWEDLFKVTNNSEHSVVVSISMDPASQGRVNIYARGPEDAWKVLSGIHGSGGKVEFTLEPGEKQYIDMKATATNGWTAEYNWKLVVDAVTVNNS